MENIYYLNVSIKKSSTASSKNVLIGNVSIPNEVLMDMGIDKDHSEIELHYDEESKEIKIKKGEKTIFI